MDVAFSVLINNTFFGNIKDVIILLLLFGKYDKKANQIDLELWVPSSFGNSAKILTLSWSDYYLKK